MREPHLHPMSLLTNVSVIASEQIQLNFSEELDATGNLIASDFILNDTIPAVSASFENGNLTIRLAFDHAMKNGHTQKIHFPAVADPSMNILQSGNFNFLYFNPVDPHPHDIIINEIYPDPSPSIGLPPYEFIEIYNQSENPFQLANWKITDGSTIGVLSNRILLPKEYLILVPNEAVASYSLLGPTMGLQFFPTLNNSGDNLQLKSPDETEIDDLTYTLTAYQNEDKDAGGYAIERIDPTDFCKGITNWKASENLIGGSPGAQNSVHLITPDLTGPKLLAVIPKTSKIVTLKFDERLSPSIPSLDNFLFPYPQQIEGATYSNAEHFEIDLTFSTDLDSTITYMINVDNVFDCPANLLQSDFSSAIFKMDVVKPVIHSVTTVSQNRVEIVFSEKISPQSIHADGISIDKYEGNINISLSVNQKLVTLDLSAALENGKDYFLSLENISDYSGNVIDPTSYVIQFFEPQEVLSKDIVINEFFADPSPVVGLPEAEFIELYNRSANAIDLSGWTITDGSTTSTLSDKIILPNTYVIVCQSNFNAGYSAFGTTMPLSTIPSLNNSGDNIKLVSADGITIDSIHYQLSWYQDDDKKDGGWSIERVNPNDFCGEIENWKASNHEKGGTPGVINSVFELRQDLASPDFVNATIVGSDTLVLFFSERLSKDAVHAENFLLTYEIGIDTAHFVDNTRKSIAIKFGASMDSLITYRMTMQNILDCPGNAMQADSAIFDFKLDNTLPQVLTATTIGNTKLLVVFSKKIKFESVTRNSFSLKETEIDAINSLDDHTVELVLDPPLINGQNYFLTISDVIDLAGNVLKPTTHSVLYFQAHSVAWKDVIISEIFADPTPPQGLPETEFVEILNRSENPIQLKNWIFQDETHESKLKPHILLPGEYLTLTLSSKAFQFENSLGVISFPTLTNGSEPLILKDSMGVTIDSVFYSDDWYRDSEKKDGGWSLELIDPNNICSEGENWTASEEIVGGTPGKFNSVIAEKPDLTPPELLSVIAISADTIAVVFNEKLAKEIPAVEEIVISPGVAIGRIAFKDQTKRSFFVKLATPLENRNRYSLTLNNISDCAGNVSVNEKSIFFALPEEPEPSDIVVNEILFNPRPTGVDFIELFNRSEKYINLENWGVANLVNDTIVNRKQISGLDFVFEPGDFLVLTSDPNLLKGEYLQAQEEKMKKVILPTLSDDEGSLVIVDDSGMIIDTLFYSDDQHSPLLKNTEGISLERVDINSPSSNKSNWQSASASSGYATPGFKNGSALQNIFEAAVSVEPEIFSTSSGQFDFAMIAYNFEHAGFVANVKIVNQQGRVVKTVAENELLGAEGFFTWRGDTTQGNKATVGAYMVWFEAFDALGNLVTLKKRVVIAEKF
jgi:hypothetical protein